MTGITIVFIHGHFVTKRCWEPWVARYEAGGHTCITIPWPGRNQPVAELKRNPDDPFLGKLTIGEVIDHHVRTIQALPAKPIIIGHSFGGLLTQLMVRGTWLRPPSPSTRCRRRACSRSSGRSSAPFGRC
jgi:pimeloyl-ACP methyl ester carboxylesterase